MLAYVVKPILGFMYFIHKTFSVILAVGIYVGRTIFLILAKLVEVVGALFAALAIIGEELYYFLCELNASVSAVSQYVRTSANGGINGVIEAVVIFCHHIRRFFLNTQLFSKLLATKLGTFVCDFFELFHNALLLIGDCAWWLITLLPRYLGHIVIVVGDAIVCGITETRKILIYTLAVIVEDIFRLTIGIVLLFLLWHNRRRLGLYVLRCILKLKRGLILCYRRLRSLSIWILRRRRTTPSAVRTTPTRSRLPRQSISPAPSDKSVEPHQRCVVCRDRQKCVVLLPCKHLCLCEECADYMIFSAQSQKCPLCRTNIVHSMSVYT
ncbi:uncharacterized protein LOC142224260 [Haematobia irritans]|uniref:uncharacterized protein LOC142224260 n=1 Tax=Haematobia irritans TaxID=7368 RepID=UPI003F4F8438